MRRLFSRISIIALALVSSFTSITNGFTYDDVHIILRNPVVHSLDGWWNLFVQSYWRGGGGGALYRPLTVLGYSVQWAAGNGAPWVFHAVNIVLYVAVCLAFYWLVRLLSNDESELSWVPWICAALFAVHPVHVEAVGNIVGQAELSCGLLVILGVGIYVKWRREGEFTPLRIVALLAIYVAAFLFKEHGILLLPLLIAAELTVVARASADSLRARMVRLRLFYLLLIALLVVFIWARSLILQDLRGDMPHLAWVGIPWSARFWTMCMVALEWFRLFLWPSTLSIDYSPGNIAVRYGPEPAMLATLTLVASVVMLAILLRKRAPIVTFGALWTAITLALVSNLIFPTGIMLAERTLFLPSAGVIMMVVGSVAVLVQAADARSVMRVRVLAVVLVSLLLFLGAIHSARRQNIWSDNKAMFIALFSDAPADYRGQWAFAHALLRSGQEAEALSILETAHMMFPRDPMLMEDLAYRYRIKGDCKRAIPLLLGSLEIEPSRSITRGRLVVCLIRENRLEEARQVARKGAMAPSDNASNNLRWVRAVEDSIRARSKLGTPTSPPQK